MTSTVTAQRYCLFRFNQAHEDRVRHNAAKYGIEVIAPRVAEWRRSGNRGNKRRVCHVPAFHSYLILGFQPSNLVHVLTDLHRSVKPMVIPFNGNDWTLAQIPLREIEKIKSNRLFRASEARNLLKEVVSDPVYAKDEVLRILGGAATGLEGKVIRANTVAREVELDMEGWPVKLVVSYDLLEKAA